MTLLNSGFETEDLLATIIASAERPEVLAQPEWQSRRPQAALVHAE